MIKRILAQFVALLLNAFALATEASGQGMFVFDQQSADDDSGGESAPFIQLNQPIGQSFTPSLSGVDFVRLWTFDSGVNGLGATLYVNLRSGSITGPIIGSTTPVFLPDGFLGRTNFLFPNQIALNPGEVYYLQPVMQSGDTWRIDAGHFNYPGGTEYFQGLPAPTFDLWFREGIIIPEPGSICLALVGISIAVVRKRRLRILRET